jgi:hypothetical protein
METPISGIFINTIKTDRSEQLKPQSTQARRARWIGRHARLANRCSIKGYKPPAIPFEGFERIIEKAAQRRPG